MFRLSDGEEIMTLAFFVLIQYRSVTDRQCQAMLPKAPLMLRLSQNLWQLGLRLTATEPLGSLQRFLRPTSQ